MKLNIYTRIAALVALCATTGLVGQASAGEAVPFRGNFEGNFVSAYDPGPPPGATVAVEGTGRATHLGRFTFEMPHSVNLGTIPPTSVGTCTFVAASGDKLIGHFVGQSSPVEPGVVLVVQQFVITEGTGRFEGASGEFVLWRLVVHSTPNTGIALGHFEGTISSPGAAKRQ